MDELGKLVAVGLVVGFVVLLVELGTVLVGTVTGVAGISGIAGGVAGMAIGVIGVLCCVGSWGSVVLRIAGKQNTQFIAIPILNKLGSKRSITFIRSTLVITKLYNLRYAQLNLSAKSNTRSLVNFFG